MPKTQALRQPAVRRRPAGRAGPGQGRPDRRWCAGHIEGQQLRGGGGARCSGNFADRTSGVVLASSLSDADEHGRRPGLQVLGLGLIAILVALGRGGADRQALHRTARQDRARAWPRSSTATSTTPSSRWVRTSRACPTRLNVMLARLLGREEPNEDAVEEEEDGGKIWRAEHDDHRGGRRRGQPARRGPGPGERGGLLPAPVQRVPERAAQPGQAGRRPQRAGLHGQAAAGRGRAQAEVELPHGPVPAGGPRATTSCSGPSASTERGLPGRRRTCEACARSGRRACCPRNRGPGYRAARPVSRPSGGRALPPGQRHPRSDPRRRPADGGGHPARPAVRARARRARRGAGHDGRRRRPRPRAPASP